MLYIRAWLCAIVTVVSLEDLGWSQQSPTLVTPSQTQFTGPLYGGQGSLFLSQFANPAVLGALYSTPNFPLTGYYPLYPGVLSRILEEGGVKTGPLVLHPFMGVAEMYTDNVFRTASNRRSDFFHTLAPGIQAQLPFMRRHMFVVDYRTNLQFYQRTPSNDVQDQTASGHLQFNMPWGLHVDLQGEHKLGHDPRGSAVDLQAVEVNKWTTNSFTGQVTYQGARSGVTLTTQFLRWDFLNNNQAVFRDRVSSYAGLTFSGALLPRTSLLLNVSALNDIYDQNKNLNSTIYTASGGVRWDITGKTTGELLVGYQTIRFNKAPVDQPGPILSTFNRRPSDNAAGGLFVAGTLSWAPTAQLILSIQPYRSIQQTVFFGSFFFTATGVNVSAVHTLTSRINLTGNLGYEKDSFSNTAVSTGGPGARTDTLKNVAAGINYRAVKWLGIGFQYVFEDRTSNVDTFNYRANTFMLSLQVLL